MNESSEDSYDDMLRLLIRYSCSNSESLSNRSDDELSGTRYHNINPSLFIEFNLSKRNESMLRAGKVI